MAENAQSKISRYRVFFKETISIVRRAFAEFLLVPTCVIGGFLLLAFGSYLLDSVQFGSLAIFRVFLRTHIFADAQATSSLLGAIASGIITMTSITISLLLLAVQQSAGSMTSQVFDQFLRRGHNQFYFGFFIGLALYSLITLATVNEPYNPVFGGTIALLGTIAALYLLLLLLYTTINQMRPVNIIEEIHDLILEARENQLRYISQTRSVSLYDGRVKLPVKAETHGFITHIHFETIEKAVKEIETEIVLLFSVGDFVAYQDVIAEVRAETNADAEKIAEAVREAVEMERQRDISLDPAYGIRQLSMIAWTSISTAKSNPAPGILTILVLRDILSRWSFDKDITTIEKTLPVVYTDNVFARLLEAFETFGIVASESMQHQTYIEVLHTFTKMLDRLNADHQKRVEDIILRLLSALGDFVLTAELNESLSALAAKLKASGKLETAAAVEKAQGTFALSTGKFNSRSTRVGN